MVHYIYTRAGVLCGRRRTKQVGVGIRSYTYSGPAYTNRSLAFTRIILIRYFRQSIGAERHPMGQFLSATVFRRHLSPFHVQAP